MRKVFSRLIFRKVFELFYNSRSMIQSYIKATLICMILTACEADIVLDRICNRFRDKTFCRQSTVTNTTSDQQQITQIQLSTVAPNAKTDFCSQNKNNFVGYCAAKAGQYALDRAVNNFCNEYLQKCDTTKNSLPNTPGLGSMPVKHLAEGFFSVFATGHIYLIFPTERNGIQSTERGPPYLATIPQTMGQYLGNYLPMSQNNLYQTPSVGAAKVMNVAPQRGNLVSISKQSSALMDMVIEGLSNESFGRGDVRSYFFGVKRHSEITADSHATFDTSTQIGVLGTTCIVDGLETVKQTDERVVAHQDVGQPGNLGHGVVPIPYRTMFEILIFDVELCSVLDFRK
uniref:Uncharacterized protein n=1 Tax=Romanomermis culicivorax TaxID=13658 RepID=A0A915JSR1_ROMCU